MHKALAAIVLTALLAPATVLSGPEPTAPEATTDGLELIEESRHGAIYAAPGIDWSIYQKIQLDEATVAFRRNWERDYNRNHSSRIRPADVQRIRDSMIEVFDKVFSSELSENGGYQITGEAGDDVMRIEPQIVDLDVYAPDNRHAAGIQRSYAETAGRMTLKLYIYDAVSGDLMAMASDHKEAPRRGYMQWANSVSNTHEFRLMMQGWAKELRERLDRATGKESD